MDETIKTGLAIWGAALSTVLAIKTLISAARDKPRIKISADIVFLPCGEEGKTKGTKIYDENSGWREIRIGLKASNTGLKSLQIVSVYVVEENVSHQIFPENIPVVLEPRTQVESTIQKEWLDNSHVIELGVLDALGKRHAIDTNELEGIIVRSNALPSNKKKYRHKETKEEVEAFQVADKTSLHSKLRLKIPNKAN